MSRAYSWDEPKAGDQPPRGAAQIQKRLSDLTNVVDSELTDLVRTSEKLRTTDRAREQLASLLEIATMRELTGDFAGAIDTARQAAALARHLDDDAAELAALGATAVLTARLGELDDAVQLQDEVRHRLASISTNRGAAASLINRGVLRMARQETVEALDLFDDAFRLGRDADDAWNNGAALNNAGVAYLCQRGAGEALRLLQRATLLRQRSGDRQGLAATYNNIGLVHAKAGDHVGAIPFLEMAAVLFADVGDVPGLAICLSNNIVAFYQQHLDDGQQPTVLRQAFADAIGLLPDYFRETIVDANVLPLGKRTTARNETAKSTTWLPVLAETAALLSTCAVRR